MMNPYDVDLPKTPANYQPLTPLSFLERSASIYPHHTAIIHGARRFTYEEFYTRSRRLASALQRLGIGRGDTVSAVMANTPPMLDALGPEAHRQHQQHRANEKGFDHPH